MRRSRQCSFVLAVFYGRAARVTRLACAHDTLTHRALWLADALLALHLGIVAFVAGLLPLVLVGGALGWRWVRHRGLRLGHLALIVFHRRAGLAGPPVPADLWEQDLRRLAGQATHTESFVGHWLARLLYWDAPWWVFVATYTAFAVLVALAWWWVRPGHARNAP